MTSRSVPGNYTVQLTNTPGDCKFPTLGRTRHQAICLHGNLTALMENIPCTAADRVSREVPPGDYRITNHNVEDSCKQILEK